MVDAPESLVVAHGMPVYRDVEFATHVSVTELLIMWGRIAPKNWRLDTAPCRAQPVAIARERIVDFAIEHCKADVILWQDSDVAVKAEDAVSLIRTLVTAPPEVAIVGAPCVLQESHGELRPNVWMPRDWPSSSNRPFRVQHVGFGLVAMRVEAMRRLARPWFRFIIEQNRIVGEDIDVCTRINDAGMEVWVDPRVRPTHTFRREFAYGDPALPALQALSK